MSSWFVEDSTPLLVIGVITEAILILAFVKTSRLGLLYAMGAVAVVTAGLVWFEKNTLTDTKRIRIVLDSAAAALETNNVPAVLAFISPSAQGMRTEVSRVLPEVKIDKAWITGLKVTVNRFNVPPSAVAEFFGHVKGSERHGAAAMDNYVERFKVTLRLENDQWLMDSYEQQGIRP
jgi:hypothetical protein